MKAAVNFAAPSLRFDVRRRSNLIPGLYNFFLIFFFFLLEQKETKIQANSPTSIFFSRKGLRNATEKIAVRSELAKQPHYYQRMKDVKGGLILLWVSKVHFIVLFWAESKSKKKKRMQNEGSLCVCCYSLSLRINVPRHCERSEAISLIVIPFIFFLFLLEQKETKIQSNSPTSSGPAISAPACSSHRIGKQPHNY